MRKWTPSLIWRKKPEALLTLTEKAAREQVTDDTALRNVLVSLAMTRAALQDWRRRAAAK